MSKRFKSFKIPTIREISNSKRISWPKWAVSTSILQAIVITALESTIIALLLKFIMNILPIQLSGSSPFIVVYFALFIIALWLQVVGAVDAVIVVSIFVPCRTFF